LANDQVNATPALARQGYKMQGHDVLTTRAGAQHQPYAHRDRVVDKITFTTQEDPHRRYLACTLYARGALCAHVREQAEWITDAWQALAQQFTRVTTINWFLENKVKMLG
jgi:chitinase